MVLRPWKNQVEPRRGREDRSRESISHLKISEIREASKEIKK